MLNTYIVHCGNHYNGDANNGGNDANDIEDDNDHCNYDNDDDNAADVDAYPDQCSPPQWSSRPGELCGRPLYIAPRCTPGCWGQSRYGK